MYDPQLAKSHATRRFRRSYANRCWKSGTPSTQSSATSDQMNSNASTERICPSLAGYDKSYFRNFACMVCKYILSKGVIVVCTAA